MENERARWNDDRIDALSERMDMKFERVDERFVQVEKRLDRFETRFDGRFDSLEAILHGFQRAMIAAMASVVIALIAQGFFPH
jgi:hypothetical protein